VSTDFNAVCDACRLRIHVGQIMGGVPSFGWGSTQTGSQIAVAAWAYEHACHGDGVRIEISDTAASRPSDDYLEVDLKDWVNVAGFWSSPKDQPSS